MAVKPIPEGYHTITPYLIVNDGSKFIDFAKKAFGAKELFRHNTKDGKIMHAEIKIGDSIIMLSEASSQFPVKSGLFNMYVQDCDATYKQALDAGATSTMEPTNQFYGDRSAGVKDPYDNTWWISTHVEDVSPEEMKKREEEYMKKKASKEG